MLIPSFLSDYDLEAVTTRRPVAVTALARTVLRGHATCARHQNYVQKTYTFLSCRKDITYHTMNNFPNKHRNQSHD